MITGSGRDGAVGPVRPDRPDRPDLPARAGVPSLDNAHIDSNGGTDSVGTGERDELDWDSWLSHLADRPHEEGWVTLKEASEASGVARSTLRSWYRSGKVRRAWFLGSTDHSAWYRSTPSSIERSSRRAFVVSSNRPDRSKPRSRSCASASMRSNATSDLADEPLAVVDQRGPGLISDSGTLGRRATWHGP